MTREKKETMVCECGAPLHWTFLYHHKEYFCMNCGAKYGMLGAGMDVEETVETKANQKIASNVFGVLRKYLIGDGGFTKSNCKKCKNRKDRYHTQHLSKREIAENEIAEKMLKKIRGYYSITP